MAAEALHKPGGKLFVFKPFLITIDTEGDNAWSRPKHITCQNAQFLPRFQTLCERYGLKPTYLTNYEMATNRAFLEFAGDAVRRGTAEIGMHLHAWHSPPHHPLTSDDYARQPYLIEFNRNVMRDKIRAMTDLLEETFNVKMVSHRAGRWALDSRYVQELLAHGYLVDCSVTPYVNWGGSIGVYGGGTDYRDFPVNPYYIDADKINRPGTSQLLELPMSIRPKRPFATRGPIGILFHSRYGYRILSHTAGINWLRPNGRNRGAMIGLAEHLWASNSPYAQFMLHSSELMPGGSPTFPTKDTIERLYDDLEALFGRVRGRFRGSTLKEFRQCYAHEA